MECTRHLAFACLVGSTFGLTPVTAFAHGSMEKPISRIYQCFKEGPEAPKSAACKALVKAGGTQPLYDWMEVNQSAANGKHKKIIADGNLCAGGRDKYAGLDLPRRDWPKTTFVPNRKGKYKFEFYATTPHATKYFRLFVTRDGWDRDKSLSWSDMERFGQSRKPKLDGNTFSMKFRLPEGKEGRHVILAIWQRSDSQEAFYSCSEVKVVAPSADTGIAVAAAETASNGGAASPEPATWTEIGQSIAHNDLAPGSTVSFRTFDAKGRDVDTHAITIDQANASADRWPRALARKVNAASGIFQIGELDVVDGALVIAPVAEAAGNIVYRSDDYPGYSYHIDIDVPQ